MGIRYYAYAWTDDRDSRYTLDFLSRAVDFMTSVAASDRGFAYLIG